MTVQALTLSQLNRRVAEAIGMAPLQNVWVVAELSDVRLSHGHCYMELMEKAPESGTVTARLRAVIWAGTYLRLSAEFHTATGQRLESGLKVMVCGTVSYHPAYGISFVISAINSSFTMGEAERRRREILQRLQTEGVTDMNRSLEWPDVPWRIAVISAPGAAGYGDFIHQLYTNDSHLRFRTKLFPALMQGDKTVPSVIAALDAINSECDSFDCVVIIRGGGATSELMAFDDYSLAMNVAQFPLPVIIGIGHERDITVLDYVANMRVKTPTAAAEWLIARGEAALEQLRTLASGITMRAADLIAGAKTHLAYLDSTLLTAPASALQRASARLQQATLQLGQTGARRITPQFERLSATARAIATAASTATSRAADRLEARKNLLDALSPAATLARGYSITATSDGHAVRSITEVKSGERVTTILADGSFTSTVN